MIRVILLAATLVAQPVSRIEQTENQSMLAPAFALKDVKGRIARPGDYKGKVVLLNFWATWCAPCQAEMPALVKWQKEYRARGLQIVGVTYPPEKRSRVLRAIRRFKLNYPVLFGTLEMAEAYDAGEVLPTTIIIDREGKIRGRILGIVEPDEFKERVEPLIRGTIAGHEK